MSAPVDVLAVMDAVLAFAARGVESDDPAREMIESGYEARAAVAELLAQRDMMANALATYRMAGVGNSTDFYLQMEASTLAAVALARIGGAA